MNCRVLVLAADINRKLDEAFSLSSQRQAKYDAFRFEDDKKRCALAELLLIKAVKEFCPEIELQNIVYGFRENEKPYLIDYPNLEFNISHSGQYVVCAVSNREIGIDIEEIADIDMKIAKQNFTNEEYASIDSLKDFYKIWTRKEAFVKATGEGIKREFKSFNVLADFDGYHFIDVDKLDNYACSICSKYLIEELKWQMI